MRTKIDEKPVTHAYRDDPKIKRQMVALGKAHIKADQLVSGTYWSDGRGCHVGCTLDSWAKIKGNGFTHDDHSRFNEIYGPGGLMLGRLSDAIFEGLATKAERAAFHGRFLAAPKVGADLSQVGWQFLRWLLTDETVNPGINHPLVRDAVRQCADVLVSLTKGRSVDASAVRSAAKSARSARSAAESAAWSAASRAAWSAASAASAARSAVWSAASAASSAASAARSAVWSAASRAGNAAWKRMADKLIKLMAAA